jgi:hypothetical protein
MLCLKSNSGVSWQNQQEQFLGRRQMRRITRKPVKVDRVGCPCLIRKFVDNDAEFRIVPCDKVMADGPGRRAIAEGLRHLDLEDDHAVKAAEWIASDALSGYCQEVVRQGKPNGDFMH